MEKMFVLFSTAVLLLASSSNGIYSGENATIMDYPHQVMIHFKGGPLCGGAIIDRNWIITTAKCVTSKHLYEPEDPKSYKIQAGAETICKEFNDTHHCGSFHSVDQIVVHEGYDPRSRPPLHNIALVRMRKGFRSTRNNTIDSIHMVEHTHNSTFGSKVIVTGYGNTTKNGYLLSVQLIVDELDHCQKLFENDVQVGDVEGQVCATYGRDEDRCSKPKDEGAPVVEDHRLVGLLSWLDGCNDALLYTDVAHYRKWIDDEMDRFKGRRS